MSWLSIAPQKWNNGMVEQYDESGTMEYWNDGIMG
jgi:hypothetical protein